MMMDEGWLSDGDYDLETGREIQGVWESQNITSMMRPVGMKIKNIQILTICRYEETAKELCYQNNGNIILHKDGKLRLINRSALSRVIDKTYILEGDYLLQSIQDFMIISSPTEVYMYSDSSYLYDILSKWKSIETNNEKMTVSISDGIFKPIAVNKGFIYVEFPVEDISVFNKYDLIRNSHISLSSDERCIRIISDLFMSYPIFGYINGKCSHEIFKKGEHKVNVSVNFLTPKSDLGGKIVSGIMGISLPVDIYNALNMTTPP